jgi:hypothetical protein
LAVEPFLEIQRDTDTRAPHLPSEIGILLLNSPAQPDDATNDLERLVIDPHLVFLLNNG